VLLLFFFFVVAVAVIVVVAVMAPVCIHFYSVAGLVVFSTTTTTAIRRWVMLYVPPSCGCRRRFWRYILFEFFAVSVFVVALVHGGACGSAFAVVVVVVFVDFNFFGEGVQSLSSMYRPGAF
jgi:hypothetical protein